MSYGTEKLGLTLEEALLEFLDKRPDNRFYTNAELAEKLAEFLQREFMQHTWINAFSTVIPTDEFRKELGQIVLDALASREHETDLLGVRGRAAFLWFNAS